MRISRIKETCIYVSDLNQTESFYHNQLGLPVIAKVPGRHIFFRAGESVLLCFIATQTEKETELPPHGARGSVHFAFEVEKEVYASTLKEVQQKNIAILHKHIWKGNLRSFYFYDPDGNLLEVIEEGLWE
jgi:catechol-2,3-dioxygenase